MTTQTKIEKFPRVIKRDGREVDFDLNKIANAITKAWEATYGEISPKDSKAIDNIVRRVVIKIRERYVKNIEISEIQSIVEQQIMHSGREKLHHNYTAYREKRDLERERAGDLNFAIQSLFNGDESIIYENANKDSDRFSTNRDQTAGIVAKSIAMNVLPRSVINAHRKGEIHWHDMDYNPYKSMTNCCLVDYKRLLENGYLMGNAWVETPKSIGVAATQATQIIADVASSQYGGTSLNRLDEVFAPYARKNYELHLSEIREMGLSEDLYVSYAKKKTQKDIYDAMQTFEYQVNTLHTTNGQTPFITIGFGLGEDWFAREIQKAILNIRIKGLGKSRRTAIFPKLVFTLKRGLNLNENDPNYDIKQLALECSIKRMYPDILSYDKIIELTGSFKAPMGCRSFLQGWKDEDGNDVVDGRMNLGVVTLNLPRIALESRDQNNDPDPAKFWQILFERLDVVGDALIFRVNSVKEAVPANAPILYEHGGFGKKLSKTDSVDSLFKNCRATVSMGFIGLYEVATVFYGPEWEDNPEAKEFTFEILRKMKERAEELSKKYGYHFSIYSTPSESLTDRFCRIDKEKFGSIPDITDKGYYTNSFHYDVRKNPTPFEKLEFEKDYPIYTSGGFIHYCEYPMIQQNPKALEAVWDYAYDTVGYLGTNAPIDHCFECDFMGDFEPTNRGFKCPQCGNSDPETCDVVKRTCGYLGNPQARPMVSGRHKEISARVKHQNGSIGNLADGSSIENIDYDKKKSKYFK